GISPGRRPPRRATALPTPVPVA
ncbi:hypothetical protein AZZ98_002037, partial [Serratia marcescens]